MKFKFFSILLAGALLSSCQDEMTRKVDLGASVSPLTEGLTFRGDTAVVKAGTDVVFQFSGDPDFISFFSGEPGNVYANIDRTAVPVEEIRKSTLTFSAKPDYGVETTTMSVYLSDDFSGLNGNDFVKDSTILRNAKWINVTDQCNFPSKNGTEVSVDIDLLPYLGKELTLAFHYKPTNNKEVQPRWTFLGMNIETDFTDGTSRLLKAEDFAFTALDMLNKLDDPYGMKGGQGRWDTRKVSEKTSQILMGSTPKLGELNEDWLVSKPLFVNATTPDTGVAIKDIADVLPHHRHVYTKPGVYKVSFVASNGNYEAFSRVVREVNLIVE
ncbi:MAG: DUF5017 domain-containing protein [Bacteroidales bacterium]